MAPLRMKIFPTRQSHKTKHRPQGRTKSYRTRGGTIAVLPVLGGPLKISSVAANYVDYAIVPPRIASYSGKGQNPKFLLSDQRQLYNHGILVKNSF
jgi:hypothetical protein